MKAAGTTGTTGCLALLATGIYGGLIRRLSFPCAGLPAPKLAVDRRAVLNTERIVINVAHDEPGLGDADRRRIDLPFDFAHHLDGHSG